MKKRVIIPIVAVVLVLVVLLIYFVSAAKPLGMARGNANIRNIAETASISFSSKMIDLEGNGNGKYTFEIDGVQYKGEIVSVIIKGTDVHFAGPVNDGTTWLYVAARDNGRINDRVWFEMTNQTKAVANVFGMAFPGNGWLVEKGSISVR